MQTLPARQPEESGRTAESSAPPTTAPGQVIPRFAEWTQQYLQAAPKDRAILLNEGVALAQQRRPIFKQLITSDP